MKHFVRYAILLLTIVAATGCQDDFAEQEIIGKGQSTVYVTLDFKPMSSALTRTSGDALKEIESLHVLLYDDKGNIKEKWQIEEYDVSDEQRTNADAENGIKAENQTKRATFKLPEEIEFGRYYMYAVANIPDLLTTYENNIATVDGLKKYPAYMESPRHCRQRSDDGLFHKCFRQFHRWRVACREGKKREATCVAATCGIQSDHRLRRQ